MFTNAIVTSKSMKHCPSRDVQWENLLIWIQEYWRYSHYPGIIHVYHRINHSSLDTGVLVSWNTTYHCISHSLLGIGVLGISLVFWNTTYHWISHSPLGTGVLWLSPVFWNTTCMYHWISHSPLSTGVLGKSRIS